MSGKRKPVQFPVLTSAGYLAPWIMLPCAGLVPAFLWTVRPLDRVSFLLFLGYAIYLIYAAAWGWSLWRLNRRGSAER